MTDARFIWSPILLKHKGICLGAEQDESGDSENQRLGESFFTKGYAKEIPHIIKKPSPVASLQYCQRADERHEDSNIR